jgi:hypothetical protein
LLDILPDLLLPGMVGGDEGHELFQRHAVLGIDLRSFGETTPGAGAA